VSFDAGTDLGTTGLLLKHDPARLTDPDATNSPANLVIDGGGQTVDLTGSPSGHSLITVGSGVTLTLRNITFKGLSTGDGDTADNKASLITVNNGGKLILEEGAVITGNCYGSSSGSVKIGHGGGVYVGGSTFTKTGGSVIYGSDENGTDANNKPLQNTASGAGHAVYVSSSSLKRNSTAGGRVNLDSRTAGSAGGWE
jgi:hypothetical protein